MQRKPFWKLLLLGVGYMMLGNIMSMIMTVALASMIDNIAIQIILFIFTAFVYLSLCFTVAYRDGIRERLMLKNHRVNAPLKFRWVKIGFAMYGIMLIPTLIFLLDKVAVLISAYMIPYRMICGAIYPLLLAIGANSPTTVDVDISVAFIAMAFYALTPLATQVGYHFGFEDKLDPDKIIYNKK